MTKRYYRKVIRIRGEDSPNVRLGMAEKMHGMERSDRQLVPGILPYGEYLYRRANWDKIRQCIGIDAQFYEGAEILLYPTLWLNLAEQYHDQLTQEFVETGVRRIAKGGGVIQPKGETQRQCLLSMSMDSSNRSLCPPHILR